MNKAYNDGYEDGFFGLAPRKFGASQDYGRGFSDGKADRGNRQAERNRQLIQDATDYKRKRS